jgi:hypothetical protein
MTNTDRMAGLIGRNESVALFGDEREIFQSTAVIAGAIAASRVLLSAEEFARLCESCEIDSFKLQELLAMANANAESEDPTLEA